MSTWDVNAGRVIYISYISHFVVQVQLANLNWWVDFNLSSCGVYMPLSATQPLSHRILTNKNRKGHIPCAYMNYNVILDKTWFLGPYTGENQAAIIWRILECYELTHSVELCSTTNTCNNAGAIKMLGHIFQTQTRGCGAKYSVYIASDLV
jgi:hypothetical protein